MIEPYEAWDRWCDDNTLPPGPCLNCDATIRNPENENVAQCNRCDGMLCVDCQFGLDPEDAIGFDDYVCRECRAKQEVATNDRNRAA